MSIVTETPIVPELKLSDGELRFYQEEGYLVIPGLIAQEYVEQIKANVLEVMDAIGAQDRLVGAQGGKGKLIQSHQYLSNTPLDGLVNSANLRRVASQLMGGDGTLYLPFTAVKSGGGGGTFHFHQDNQYTRFDGPGINLWCALSKMTPENGCLQVVPRSHLGGTIDSVQNPDGDGHRTVAKEPDHFLPVRMNPGDCIAFSRLTLHGSGPNHTQEPRVAYALQFHRDDVNWLKDGEWTNLKQVPRWDDIYPREAFAEQAARARDGH